MADILEVSDPENNFDDGDGDDTEGVDFIDVNSVADEEQDARDREIISIVRANPPLYAKNKKEYCGKNFNSMLAWESVAHVLSYTTTGPETKARFYKIRQKFGKEWRKYTKSLKGVSGQALTKPYRSNWSLYEDCLFLSDHIEPRKTSTSYKSSQTVPLTPQATPPSLQRGRGTRRLGLSPTFRASPTPSQSSPSAAWSSDVELFSPSEDGAVAVNLVNGSAPSTITSGSACTSSTNGASSNSTFAVPAPQEVRKAMEKAANSSKRTTPEPDTFAKRQRIQEAEFMKSMMAQSKALTDVACKVGEALQSEAAAAKGVPASASGASKETMNPMLTTIQFALGSVAEEDQLQCLTEILNIISTKYVKKH